MIDKYTPAFPTTTEHGFNSVMYGMNLRDYFAAKAMASYILDEAIHADSETSKQWLENIASAAYEMADAMMETRKEPTHDQ